MASPATARRSEPNQPKFQSDLDAPQSPPIHAENPRPSISPLSAKASPVAVRETALQNANTHEESRIGNVNGAEVGDQDDDRSSSLSEPEDDDEVDPVPGAAIDNTETFEELAAHQSLEVDSEAETERLDQTPTKLRKDADTTGKTPSKLSQAATADDDLSDPPSPIPATGPGAASSTSTIETAGRKRKRSDTGESSLSSADSDIGESPRKRSHSSAAEELAAKDRNTEIPALNAEDTVEEAIVDDSEAVEATPTSPTKGVKGKKGPKPKGRPKKDASKETELQKTEEPAPVEEQGEEAIAKSAEELQRRQVATVNFEDLAKQFLAFREKTCNEKLAAVDAELELLNQPVCKHPDFMRQVACVDARKQKQKREAEAWRRYKKESLRTTTLGERSQLHSQFFQHTRQLREDVMDQLGKDWYDIQNERRQSNQDKDELYVRKFSMKKSEQIKIQAKYNQEVSVLSGVAKYVGFPAAPEITGAEGDSLEDDLKSMKISKRAHHSSSHPQTVYFPNRASLIQPQSERIAHEQFIEQNPWARPQGPIQHHGTPNLTHTPDWAAEPGIGSKHIIRNLSGASVQRTGSPYMTPMQRRPPVDHSSSGTVAVNSDGPEPPSSLAAAPPTEGRTHGHPGRDLASPLTVAKHRQNGAELTGFRNISNISGASTIDAPDSAEKARDGLRESLPGISKESSAPQHIFDTSQIHRLTGDVRKQHEVYANANFRPQEGAYGTPGPLPASSGPP
ncbi:Transcriptional regulatory protein DEP1 [Pseudocercospora fuligena]|uniref:Transcriptional regulatory protein DEP1 n=1 Tax=Pseudocercospora fuligena TaxID=685502 RepID=A0A8H6VD72_9PEZI|nr:Transcriptional regulatory protein DEP1 [Pseudocercospora fuligena]